MEGKSGIELLPEAKELPTLTEWRGQKGEVGKG